MGASAWVGARAHRRRAAPRLTTKLCAPVSANQPLRLASAIRARATFADAGERAGDGRSAGRGRRRRRQSARTSGGSSRRSRRATTCSTTSSASTSIAPGGAGRSRRWSGTRVPDGHLRRPVRRHPRRRRRAVATRGLRGARRRRRLRRADAARRRREGAARRSCRRSSPTRSTCRSRDDERVGRHRRVRNPQRRRSRRRAARGPPRARAGRAIRHSRVHHAALGGRARALSPLLPSRAAAHRRAASADIGRAYAYLPRSVANFPTEERARRANARARVSPTSSWRTLTLGVAAIHTRHARR